MSLLRLFALGAALSVASLVAAPEGVVEGRVALPKAESAPVVQQRYEIVSKEGTVATNPPLAVVYVEGPFPRTEAAAVFLRHAAATPRVATLLSRPALAISPIAAIDPSPRTQVLATGLTVDLTSLFARWCWFPVIAARSTGALEPSGDPAKLSGLVARFLVHGTLRARRDGFRLVVQVDDAETGRCAWTERFDFPDDDVFLVEDEIAERIVAMAYPVLVAHSAARPRAIEAEELSSWELAHEGMALQSKRDRQSHAIAQARLAAAVAREPTLVLGHFGLGLCAYDTLLNQWGEEREASAQLAASVESCLRLAPHGAEGSFLAARFHQSRGQHVRAIGPLEEAIGRNPSFAPAHALLAQVLCIAAREDEGLVRMRHAVRLGPHAFVAGLAVVHFLRAEYEPALAYAEAALATRPTYPFATLIATASAWWLGDHARARTLGALLASSPAGFAASTFTGRFGPSVEGVARIHQAMRSLDFGA